MKESESIVIEVDGKPVAKGRGRIGKVNGHPTIFTPAKTRQNENLIKMAAMKVMAGRDPIAGAVEVFVHAYLPYPKSMSKNKLTEAVMGRVRPVTKPDIDNYVKSALDGINTIVIVDDNQVVSLYAHKVYRSKPSLRIEVRECYVPKRMEEFL